MIQPLKEMRIVLSISISLLLGAIGVGVYTNRTFFFGVGAIFFGWIFFVFYFARNPKRHIPEGDRFILAPADGRIRSIKIGEGIRIHIFLSLFDVHVNRIPVEGRINDIRYEKGKFFPAFTSGAMKRNERNTIDLDTKYGRIQVSQIAGLIARRIVCPLKQGQMVQAGELFGMIKFGSGMEVVLPSSFRLQVKKGDRVLAGETVLCEFE